MEQQPNPPPPQAGKFKPRKPAKKVSVGGVVPETVTSTTTIAAAARPAPSSRGGRGGGRGRGRGTGRGSRAPIPQGKAFFTAQPATQSSLSGRGGNSSNNSCVPESSISTSEVTSNQLQTIQQQKQARRKRDNNNNGIDDEEIVGTLDEAVGYTLNVASGKSGQATDDNSNTAKGSTVAASNLDRVLMGKTALSQTYQGPNGYMYDSDSSDDEDEMDEMTMPKNVGIQRPLTLPFPSVTKLNDSHRNGSLDSNIITASVTNENPTSQFPFINTNDGAYFLVQLPTRLPPVVRKDAKNDPMTGSTTTTGSSDPDVRIVEPVAVATPPIQSNAFDNVLQNAKPGRIGKLRIYRSGKTVLVIDPPSTAGSKDDQSTPIIMNVSEGLRCEFEQQAVSINIDQRTYTTFGRVNGTMVMTPDF